MLRPLLFARVESQILQHQHAARCQLARLALGVLTHRIGRKFDVLAQQFAESFGGRLQAEFGDVRRFAFRTAQVAHQNHRSATFQYRLDGRERHLDARIVRDVLILVERNVEVDTHQYGLVGNIHILNRLFGHGPFLCSCNHASCNIGG